MALDSLPRRWLEQVSKLISFPSAASKVCASLLLPRWHIEGAGKREEWLIVSHCDEVMSEWTNLLNDLMKSVKWSSFFITIKSHKYFARQRLCSALFFVFLRWVKAKAKEENRKKSFNSIMMSCWRGDGENWACGAEKRAEKKVKMKLAFKTKTL